MALIGTVRTVALVLAVAGAGIAGGYVGGILAALEVNRTPQASSHSPGLPDAQAVSAAHASGRFEEIGRAVDQFNAQLDENWRVLGSVWSYMVSQGVGEIKRAWTGPNRIPRPDTAKDI